MTVYYHLSNKTIDLNQPACLYQDQGHEIYWIGVIEETAFRCNIYLIKDGDRAWLVDPGSREAFEQSKKRVLQVVTIKQLEGMILCHEDPDVAASMVDWLELKPSLKVYTTPRTQVLIPHYGATEYDYVDVVANPTITFKSGKSLQFIESPFLHFPGAFVSYDHQAKALFSGDIWAALDINWQLVVEDFAHHKTKMDLFHKDYMASNIACRGFVNRIKQLEINAIFPQHGSIIAGEHTKQALDYLEELKCGLDIIYADLQGDVE